MVFEKLGSNLLDLIKLHNYKGIPLPVVKCMAKQVSKGGERRGEREGKEKKRREREGKERKRRENEGGKKKR